MSFRAWPSVTFPCLSGIVTVIGQEQERRALIDHGKK